MMLVVLVSIAFGEPKIVKVEIHSVEGCKVTEVNLMKQIDTANAADKPKVKYVIDSNHVYGPNTPYDPNKNDPCRVNMWGLPKNPWAVPFPNDVDPNVSAQWGSVVILVPGDGNEPGPNEPNGSGIFIKPSTGAHELNHILLGPAHSDDPNNKMYPDNWPDANGVVHSCHRRDTQLTPEQRTRLSAFSVVSFAHDVMTAGRGGEIYDSQNDVSMGMIDLIWAQGWMEWIGGRYMLYLTAHVRAFSQMEPAEIGFYFDSDNDIATGEPPEGLDCYLACQTQFNEPIFKIFEPGLGWVNLPPPEGMIWRLSLANPDSNRPPFPVGVEIDVPLASFIPLSGNFAFKASATNYAEKDLAPNVGLLGCSYPPVPIPGDLNLDNKVNLADLQLLSEQWPQVGSFRADIYPPIGDNMVHFSDFAIFANSWGAGIP